MGCFPLWDREGVTLANSTKDSRTRKNQDFNKPENLIFMIWVRTICSCTFQQSRIFSDLKSVLNRRGVLPPESGGVCSRPGMEGLKPPIVGTGLLPDLIKKESKKEIRDFFPQIFLQMPDCYFMGLTRSGTGQNCSRSARERSGAARSRAPP